METIKESLKRIAVEDARETALLEELAQWERNAYALGKEITLKTCGTEERRNANLSRFGYNMEMDSRFKGDHAGLGYDGAGPDPCDDRNKRGWLLNASVGDLHVRLGKGMRRH